jgi:hypothetical protein
MSAGVRDVILRDGTTMRLARPGGEDREGILALFAGLSADSLGMRFRAAVSPT